MVHNYLCLLYELWNVNGFLPNALDKTMLEFLVKDYQKIEHNIKHIEHAGEKALGPRFNVWANYIGFTKAQTSLKPITFKEAKKINKIQNCLIQFNVAQEETKAGFNINEYEMIINHIKTLDNVCVQGIMLMGPHVEENEKINKVFKDGKELFDTINEIHPINILSMGMSNDYNIAILNGATHLRIGSALFK